MLNQSLVLICGKCLIWWAMDKLTALPQVLLGFDFGMRCIGVAVGQMVSGHAQALTILKAQDGRVDWPELDQLCQEWQVEGFVLGLPEGDNVPKTFKQTVRKFGNRLVDRYHYPLYYADEHYSTAEARQRMAGQKQGKQTRLDAEAAAIILQSWLDQQMTRSE